MSKSLLSILVMCLLICACSTYDLKTQSEQTERTPAGREQYDHLALNYQKPVLLIMAEMNSSNKRREEEIGTLISKSYPQIRYCFEKVSVKAPADARSIFYFSVDTNGQFSEITSEADRATSSNKNFHVCITQVLESLRASNWGQKLSFRFKTTTLTE